ncbi:MAG: malto-oligosyltrehalose synthase [Pseudohongiella sp.]|nr:malto-oligosyltrehalose synthase [Pseudohongiella sp.]
MIDSQGRVDTNIRATVRLQFHKEFTLDDAVPLVPYFASLGISHLYTSPLTTARPDSTHCYDVVDPTCINPEIGGEPALKRLVRELKQHQMGLILDVVSNHMAVGGSANRWWLDVLEWGTISPYSRFFDIDWHSHDPFMKGLILLPFLRTDYGEVLANNEITVHYDQHTGEFYAAHYDHRFPLYPPSYESILALSTQRELRALAAKFGQLEYDLAARPRASELKNELRRRADLDSGMLSINECLTAFESSVSENRNRLHELLEQQHYRLAGWRTASDDINWRRFFDINELCGLRVEDPVVFEATHEKIFDMISAGWIDGLRIDHVDGLANPRAYCRKLNRRIGRLLSERNRNTPEKSFPIYIEKITGECERIPTGWGVAGSTGYDFSNQVSLLQHDPAGESVLTRLWEETSQRPANFMAEVYEAKKLLLTTALAGDFETVAQGLLQIAREQAETRDLTLGSIRRALTELVAHFPVYRTYVGPCGRSADDELFFRAAVKCAGETLSAADWPTLERIDQWLGTETLRQLRPGSSRTLRRQVLTRFQQLTSPAAAKSVEDTAFYRAGVLLSRYDVGFDAQNFSAPVESFHYECQQRLRHFPHSLLNTATHDSKRGEDVRTRLAVLSERASWFAEKLQQWRAMAEPLLRLTPEGPAPTPGDEAILYQTLLGSWPLTLDPRNQAGLRIYLERLLQWQQKALREAKLQSSWSAINQAYESACADFLTRLLTSPDTQQLRDSIAEAALAIAPAGALNSLSQCLLRMTCPGVPDLYQGTELWDFNLVDPDNRRRVNFDLRIKALNQARDFPELLAQWRDGHIKQWLIAKTLDTRKKHPRLFSLGTYLELPVKGEKGGHIVAFARCLEDDFALIAAPVRSACLLDGDNSPRVGADHWHDTFIELPEALQANTMHSAFGGPDIEVLSGRILVADLLQNFPVNFLLSRKIEQEANS